jgi:hypothetical protein
MNVVEQIIKDTQSSFDIKMPKTLLDEETKSRFENMKKRF